MSKFAPLIVALVIVGGFFSFVPSVKAQGEGAVQEQKSCQEICKNDQGCIAACEYAKAHYKAPKGYTGVIPECAFSGTCREVNTLLGLMISQANLLFGLIGSVALAMFVYGGFMMIFSFGNADKIKKGRDILIAAVVGLVIAFSAYLIVKFVLDALQVSDTYKGIN